MMPEASWALSWPDQRWRGSSDRSCNMECRREIRQCDLSWWLSHSKRQWLLGVWWQLSFLVSGLLDGISRCDRYCSGCGCNGWAKVVWWIDDWSLDQSVILAGSWPSLLLKISSP